LIYLGDFYGIDDYQHWNKTYPEQGIRGTSDDEESDEDDSNPDSVQSLSLEDDVCCKITFPGDRKACRVPGNKYCEAYGLLQGVYGKPNSIMLNMNIPPYSLALNPHNLCAHHLLTMPSETPPLAIDTYGIEDTDDEYMSNKYSTSLYGLSRIYYSRIM
jgi:hypothetical protein